MALVPVLLVRSDDTAAGTAARVVPVVASTPLGVAMV